MYFYDLMPYYWFMSNILGNCVCSCFHLSPDDLMWSEFCCLILCMEVALVQYNWDHRDVN